MRIPCVSKAAFGRIKNTHRKAISKRLLTKNIIIIARCVYDDDDMFFSKSAIMTNIFVFWRIKIFLLLTVFVY